MANKVLDLILKLSVQGTKEAEQLQKAVESLKTSVATVKGRSLDDILAGTPAKIAVDNLTAAVERLKAKAAAGGIKLVDLDPTVVSKVDLLLVKGKQLIDLFAQAGRNKVELDTSAANRNLDLIVNKFRQVIDLAAVAGRTKIDFNLTKIEAEAQRAARALQQVATQQKIATDTQVQAARAAKSHGESIAGLTREFLLFRRALYGLGIVTAAREVLLLVQNFDKARQALRAVFGETEAAQQFEFIRVQAERLGLSITQLAQDYAKFSAAGRALGLDQKIIEENFLAVAEAGSVLALSAQEVSGALIAIQQIASKGKLSLEELRQQLGDRIPGAISIAAKGLGITEARLFALVEQGKITSKQFLETFPAALRASFGTDSQTRINTTTAAIQRFQNALQELIDNAIRAGALDAFVESLKALSDVAKDPATVEFLKKVSKYIADGVRFVIEHAEAITTLIKAYVGFKALKFVEDILVGWGTAFVRLNTAVNTAIGGLQAVSAASTALAASAGTAVPVLSQLATLILRVIAAAANPIVLTLSLVGGIDLILLDKLIKKMDEARDAQARLTEAARDYASAERIDEIVNKDADALNYFADTVALTRKEIDSLSADGIRGYQEAAQGAKDYNDQIVKSSEARINLLKKENEYITATGDKSNEAYITIASNKEVILQLQEEITRATAESAKFAQALEDVAASARKQDIPLSDIARSAREATKNLKGANHELETLQKIDISDLSKDAQGMVSQFEQLEQSGARTAKIFEQVIPKDFADGGIKAISDVGQALALLEQQGKATASVLGDQIAKALDKLSGEELNKFGINAQAAFEQGKLSAQGLALILDGQLKAALKNMGVDAEAATSKVSKGFKELLDNFSVIAQNAKVTGAQLKAALDIGIRSAKTREELLALKQQVQDLGLASGKMGKDIADSLTRLDDRIRLSAQEMDSALGDSFDRLGVKAKQQLDAIAAQAQVDFDRIKASGQATAVEMAKAFEKTQLGESFERLGVKAKFALDALANQARADFEKIKNSGMASAQEVEAAFRKMAEEVTKANGGIPPIDIVIRAVDFNAFDLIVKAAEEASVKVRKAIEQAIPLAETKKQLTALADAIRAAFDKGKISAEEFGKLITEVGFKIREVAAKPVGEVAAAAELLGVKTKEQLRAAADNAKEAFDIMRTSGQFTQAELAKAAAQYYEAYKAANDGVVDSFDPVIEKALEVMNATNQITESVSALGQKATTLSGVGASDLREKGLEELQRLLTDTIKAYRAIGIQNVQDLQIVQAIQREINIKGQENSQKLQELHDKMIEANQKINEKNAADLTEKAGGKAGGGGAVAGGIGAQTINFNISGSVLDADSLRRQVMPYLTTTAQRRR